MDCTAGEPAGNEDGREGCTQNGARSACALSLAARSRKPRARVDSEGVGGGEAQRLRGSGGFAGLGVASG